LKDRQRQGQKQILRFAKDDNYEDADDNVEIRMAIEMKT
jgi:hypothetical protein